MKNFTEIFQKIFDITNPKTIVEIGYELGGSTSFFAAYAKNNGALLYVIDPTPLNSPEQTLSEFDGYYKFLRATSLEVLDSIIAEIFFIDGDHNYWTVHSELTKIYAKNPEAIVVLHDVAEPCARRDQYYSPEKIPNEHRLPYTYDHGVDLVTGEMIKKGGFWGAGNFAIAREAGNPKNGVLTAIEDFIEQHSNLSFDSTPIIFGLGIITPAQYKDQITGILTPYKGHTCLNIENNRIYLYNEYLKSRRTRTRRIINKILTLLKL